MKLLYLLIPVLLVLLSCSGEAPEILEYSLEEVTQEDNGEDLVTTRYTFKYVVSDADKDFNQVHFNCNGIEGFIIVQKDLMKSDVDTFFYSVGNSYRKSDSIRYSKHYIVVSDDKDNYSVPSDTIIIDEFAIN